MKFRPNRVFPILATLLTLFSLGSILGCQGVSSSSASSTQAGGSTPTITISPATATVDAGLSQQFTAIVKGGTNTAVSWLVNNVAGGNSSVGTISSTGLYTAPKLPPAHPVSVTASSVADPADSASAVVTVEPTPSPVSVTVSPTSASVQVSLSQQFTASVQGSSNTAVTWLVNGVAGGNSTSGTITSGGSYTAPQSVPTGGAVTVTARSSADSTKSASAAVTVLPSVGKVTVTVSPTSANVAGGNAQQFTATVTGTSNTNVTWSVNGVSGGNTTIGTISSSGLYSAPACPSASNVTVTATSVYDSTASANAAVTVSPGGGNGDYYVATTGSDSNNGSACSPWATISYAVGQLQPGVTVHVLPGTYDEAVQINAHGTASAPITIISDLQWGAKIAPTSSPLATVLIGSYTTGDGDYINFVGFDVSGAPANGILTYGSHDRILGNDVHDLVVPCNGNGGSGINSQNIYAAGYNEISGNVVHDVKPPSSCGQHHGSGIYFLNPYGIAYNNIVYRNGQTGIQQWHAASNGIIANNLIFSNADTGLLVGCGDSGCVLDDYTSVDNNMVFDNGNWGLRELDYCSGCNIGTHNVYNNNIVFGNTPGNNGVLKGTVKNLMTIDPSQGTLFVNWQPDGSGDYHLKKASPAIDAGSTSCAIGVSDCVPVIDYEGGPRPFGAAWDIGPYEWGSTPGVWYWWKF